MALPKRKHSKSRRDKRRTHVKTQMPQLAPCPECDHKKVTHAVCSFCGYYDGKKVITTREENLKAREEKKKKKMVRQ